MSYDNNLKTTGNLFTNDYKKEDKHPDYTGALEITSEQVDELVKMGQAGDEVKLKLSCWIYPSKRDPENEIRLFLVAEAGGQRKKQGGWGNKNPGF